MFNKTTLKNGLRIIVHPIKNTRTITLLVLFGVGSKDETKRINGISHFLEHMVFKGTKNRPNPTDIVREIDKVGGMQNAFTDKEVVGFWVKVDSKHFDLASDILSDMVLNPLFKKEEIDKEKGTIIEEINMYLDTPQRYILDLWENLLYGDQPAGWLTAGEKETVSKISREDFLNYLKEHFTPKNALVCVAGGNLNKEEATKKIKKYFQGFKESLPKKRAMVKEVQQKPSVLISYKDTDQTHFCLGVRAYDIFSPKRYILEVMSNILGGNMSSRLFIEIREKRGMAYYIRTIAGNYTDTGYLVTHTGIDNKRVCEAIEIVLEQYKNLKEERVPDSELRKAKESVKGHIYLGLETSDAWASYLAMQEILTKKILTPEQECAMIDKVTADDILKVAQDIFRPEKLNLALIGPFKDKTKFEKILKI